MAFTTIITCGASVTQGIVMPEGDAEVFRHDVELVAGEFGPRTLCDAHAVEPGGFNHCPVVDAAGRRQRALVEVGVCNGGPPSQVSVNDVVHIGKARLACDMVRGDAVDSSVEAAEVIARIEQGLVF